MKRPNVHLNETTYQRVLIFTLFFSVPVLAAIATFGTPLIVQVTGPVTAQFVGGASSIFGNALYLDSPANALDILFNNYTSAPSYRDLGLRV